MKGKINFRDSVFCSLASEILVRETLKATLIAAIENNSPRFPVSQHSEELTLDDYDFYFNQLYYEQAAKFQDYYTKLIKTRNDSDK